MKRGFIIAILFMAVASGGYYYLFNPAHIYKHVAEQALQTFTTAIAGKDRKQVSAALQKLLSDDATIHLEISFLSITQQDSPAMAQNFDKPSLISFVDNTLYALDDYTMELALETFALAADRKTAAITFAGHPWADGISYYGGTPVHVRYSGELSCSGMAMFAGKTAFLRQADCRLQLRMVPKPEEVAKFRDPAMIQKLLQ